MLKNTGNNLIFAKITSITAPTAFLLLILLHFLKPDFDPSWRMVSEYAIGDWGWAMHITFILFAASSFSCFFALRSKIKSTTGKIGLVFLITAAISLSFAAIFGTDPITTEIGDITLTGIIHGLAAGLGMPSIPFAAGLISIELLKNKIWKTSHWPLLVLANIPWMSLATMGALFVVGIVRTGGAIGPEILIGWPNRILMFGYLVWLTSISINLIRLYKSPTTP